MEREFYSVITHPIASTIMKRALGKDSLSFYDKSEENLLGLLIGYISVSRKIAINSIEQIPFVLLEVHQLLSKNPTGEKIKQLPYNLTNVSNEFLLAWSDNSFFATSDGWEDSDKTKQLIYIKGLQSKLEQLISRI